MKVAHPTVIFPLSENRNPKAKSPWPSIWQWPCPWTDCAEPPSPAPSPLACHAPSPLPRPCFRAPAFPADSCVGTVEAGLGTWNKVQTWRGRQTAWNSYQMYPECASGMPGISSPEEAAQPPYPYLPPLLPLVICPFPLTPESPC